MLNVKKTKKYIAVFAVVAIVAIGSIGTAVAALAADNMPKIDTDKVDMKLDITSRDIIKEIPMATEALPKKAPTLLSEKIDDTIQIYTGQETLISVKLSDERKFTLEEWQDILKKIENGEIRVEAEK